MAASSELAVYRFALEDLYRQQEHVLDDKGEHLLSLSSRFSSSPNDAYAALSTADVKHPTVTLSNGAEATLTYGQYRAILATNRNQADRAAAFHAFHKIYEDTVNTYASLYNGVLQRDWFYSQARGYAIDARRGAARQQHPDRGRREPDRETKAGTEPLRRYHRLRKRALGARDLPFLRHGDSARRVRPEVSVRRRARVAAGVGGARSATDYQRQMREVLDGQCIDVYENPGKRSGAYSAPVYGVQPYMLLNYNDTLDAVFTLAHEMGHSMHTVLSHAHQPFVYAGYTIFVAEVPSTLSEALFLEYMLARTTDERERIVLLQHAIDGIVVDVLHAGDVRRLRAAGAPAGGGREAGDGRGAGRDLLRPAEGVSRRRARLRRAVARHLGAHPALLQHAVLRLPVRDLLRLERAADAAADRRRRGESARRRSSATSRCSSPAAAIIR